MSYDQADLKKVVTDFKMHTKTDEKCFIKPNEPKIKARCVIEENDYTKIILGPIIKHIAKICKKIFPWYGSGISNKERGLKVANWIKKIPNYNVICIDGSAFDTTQYDDIMREADQEYIMSVIENHPEIAEYANMDHVHMIVNNLIRVFRADIKDEVDILAWISGTTGSGQMNTSNGNTFRAGTYILYTAYKLGYKYGEDFFFECSGDDTIILIDQKLKDSFIKGLYEHVYVPEMMEGKHKLGQVAKQCDVFDSIIGAEYLSSHFIMNDDGAVKMIRRPDRFLQLTSYTRSVKANRQDKILKELDEFLYCDQSELDTWKSDITLYNSINDMWKKQIGKQQKTANFSQYYNSHIYVDRSDEREDSFEQAFIDYLFKIYNIAKEEYLDFCKVITNNTDRFAEIKHSFIDKIYNLVDSKKTLNKCAIYRDWETDRKSTRLNSSHRL